MGPPANTARECLLGARHRMGSAGWTIAQTPIAAGLSWYIAHTLLGHHQPFFAPMSAALSLSASRVLRGQRTVQMILGVILGIGVGTAVRAVAGPTANVAIEIAVATLIALVVALVLGIGFLGQGMLFVNQAVVSAILVIAVTGLATGTERLFDALIGGGCTVVLTTILFPAAPLPLIQDACRRVFGTFRDALARLQAPAAAGPSPGPDWVIAAGQRVHTQLAALQQATATARHVVNFAPRRWPDRARVAQAADQNAPLPLLAGAVLSLVHVGTDAPLPASCPTPWPSSPQRSPSWPNPNPNPNPNLAPPRTPLPGRPRTPAAPAPCRPYPMTRTPRS